MTINKWFRPYGGLLPAVLFLGLLIAGCEDEPGTIGLEIQPETDKPLVAFFDSISIQTFTIPVDSVRSDERQYSLLGDAVDPVFGGLKASFITQVTLPGLSFFPGDTPVLDSAVMHLRINKHYGDELTTYRLKLYELIQAVEYDSAYYSSMDPSPYLDAVTVGMAEFTPEDTIISFTLDQATSQKFIADSAALSTASNFREYFYGFYAEAERLSGEGSIVSFDLLSDDSRVELFYANEDADSLSVDFLINTACARINLYQYDPGLADPSLKVLGTGMGVQDSVCYVQGLAGMETLVHFPFPENWTERIPGSVNKVTLEIPIETEDPTQTDFEPPSRLFIYYINEEGLMNYLPDYELDQDYFGGYYDKADNVYRFNITDYYHLFLMGKTEDFEMHVRVSDYTVVANRVVLSSGINSRPVVLKVTYTAF